MIVCTQNDINTLDVLRKLRFVGVAVVKLSLEGNQ